MRQLSRLQPKLPVDAMKTYQVSAPLATHFRIATCEEVDCKHHREGWKSVIDESSTLGQMQAYHIRNRSGRRYTEDRNRAPGMTVFVFEPGQKCFSQHHVPLERPALYVVRDGDWRGNPTGSLRKHTKSEDWVDDFQNHQDKLATELQKG